MATRHFSGLELDLKQTMLLRFLSKPLKGKLKFPTEGSDFG
jgi:hypothetical protein